MKSVVVGTAGHIDHGKSALVRALTGIDPDRLKEEKARGITIDLGFAHLTHGDTEIALVDVPGHERFVKNMLAGAGGIDAVLLVVDANESVMPQTREHFAICRLLGADRGVIALTKIDIAEPAAIARAKADVAALVEGSGLASAPIVGVSAVSGEGLDALKGILANLAGRQSRQHREGAVRLPIDRVFTVKGFGAVVTGTLVSGTLTVNDTLTVLPKEQTVRVRGLQVHGAAVSRVSSPSRVAVNLAGVDAAELYRGMALATPGALAVTWRADVRLRVLDEARPLLHGARVRVHQGTAEVCGRVSVAAMRTRPDAKWEPASAGDARVEVPAGGEAFARLRFERPTPLTRGDLFVVRAGSPAVTIGGGIVVDPEPASSGVRKADALDRFMHLDQADRSAVVDLLLVETGTQGLAAADLTRRAGISPVESDREVASRLDSKSAMRAGDMVFSESARADVESRLQGELARFHREQPREPGLPRQVLRDRIGRRAAAVLVDAVIDALVARGAARGTDRLSLSSHQPELSAGESSQRQRFEARVREAGLTPPDLATLTRESGIPEPEARQAVQALVREGRLVRMGDFVFHREPLGALRAEVAAMRSAAAPGSRVTLDVGDFKARHGLTRKHAIPLLEWLDRERVTRRLGDVRVVLG